MRLEEVGDFDIDAAMPQCLFKRVSDGQVRCTACDRRVKTQVLPVAVHARCRVDRPAPTLLDKATSYGAALAKWAAAGGPMRSKPEIERIHDICGGCEQFDGVACRLCGCNCNTRESVLNKIAMATENCPAKKW